MSRSKIITTLLLLLLCGLVTADVDHDSMPIAYPQGYSFAASTTEDMNAANDLFGATFIANATSITGVKVYVSALAGTEANRKLTVYITALDAAGNPDEGAPLANGTKEITGAAIVAGINLVAFATPPTTTVGTIYGVLVKNTAVDPTTDKFTIYYRTFNNNLNYFPFSISSTDGGGTWTRSLNSPSVCPYYSDGKAPRGFYPGYAAGINTLASDHDPDEYATAFTVTNTTACVGVLIQICIPANTDIVIKFIEDTTTKQTITIDDTNGGDGTSLRNIFVPLTSYACTSGKTYYISLFNSTTTHNSTSVGQFFYNATDRNLIGGTKMYGAVRTDAGAWTAYNSGVDYRLYSIIPIFAVETISTSGTIRTGFNGGFDQ